MTRDPSFMAEQVALEAAYLAETDEIRQSGFGGGSVRWTAERSPLTAAVHRDGSFLDVGCANGRLVRDVRRWAAEHGFEIEPHGVDLGQGLIRLAQQACPADAGHYVVADAWRWQPPRRWTYVYGLLDQSPTDMWCQWIDRLLGWVEPGGRLIMGSYGSRSRQIEPVDVAREMRACGYTPAGACTGGVPPVARFAWIDVDRDGHGAMTPG